MFQAVSPPIIRSSKTVHTASGICQACLLLPLAASKLDIYQMLCVQFLSSWWRAQKPPETCTALTVIKNTCIVQRCILLVILKRIVYPAINLQAFRRNVLPPRIWAVRSSVAPPTSQQTTREHTWEDSLHQYIPADTIKSAFTHLLLWRPNTIWTDQNVLLSQRRVQKLVLSNCQDFTCSWRQSMNRGRQVGIVLTTQSTVNFFMKEFYTEDVLAHQYHPTIALHSYSSCEKWHYVIPVINSVVK